MEKDNFNIIVKKTEGAKTKRVVSRRNVLTSIFNIRSGVNRSRRTVNNSIITEAVQDAGVIIRIVTNNIEI